MITINPLEKLDEWIAQERSDRNPFAHGAVLGTQGEDGMPRTRMLGVSFDSHKMPKFHTSPMSRKVRDISVRNTASLTFAFQQKMRSVSLEGFLKQLSDEELSADWKTLDPEFRRNYLVFGHQSGMKLDSLQELYDRQEQLPNAAEEIRPLSFIGYKFNIIQRISFYSVMEKDFAHCELYEFNSITQCWNNSLRVP
jgi:pyridoxine/pyridoxamine 5'-phosphate oxidase